jgi:predicted transcriptional regulator YheO
MKTVKQIADMLGIDKQRIYRYIRKNRISESHHETGVIHYDEAVETAIIQHFSRNTVSSETHQTVSNDTVVVSNDTVIATLRSELDAKNQLIFAQQRSINELTKALENTTASLNAAHALHAGTIQRQLADGQTISKPKQKKRSWLDQLLFGTSRNTEGE